MVHIALEGLACRSRGRLIPQPFYERARRNALAASGEKDGENQSLLVPAEPEFSSVVATG